jgi:transposase
MSTHRIERVDEIPIIFHWLTQMRVAELIDQVWPAHGNWQGLSYGQLAVLFITYVVHSLNHRLSGMEDWVAHRQRSLERITGWSLDPKDATDDRLGILLGELGSSSERRESYEIQAGQHLIRAYALPTRIARYDTTSVNVYHDAENNPAGGVLAFGYSKDRRPDLLQFKQALGTLDPAGVPLFTVTLNGNTADDDGYVPAWWQLANTIGHRDFFLIGDSKGAALATRGQLAYEGGYYLFPLPMTGTIPEQRAEWVRQPPQPSEPIWLDREGRNGELEKYRVGEGFTIEKRMTIARAGQPYEWSERWFVMKSESHAHRQKQQLLKRLTQAEQTLRRLYPQATESRDELLSRANKILEKQGVSDFMSVQIDERISYRKCYLRRGRPGPTSAYEREEIRTYRCGSQRNEEAIKAHIELMGWRIYVTNIAADRMSLTQSVDYYRDEWTVERGFHRFKRGSLPVSPVFIRIPERIKGLLFLLFIALQVLTLIEFVARRELAKENGQLAGLVPGNPKTKTARPTAERLLAKFDELHVIVERNGLSIAGYLVEALTPLQERILSLLKLPKELYNLSFTIPVADLNTEVGMATEILSG